MAKTHEQACGSWPHIYNVWCLEKDFFGTPMMQKPSSEYLNSVSRFIPAPYLLTSPLYRFVSNSTC